MRADYEPIMQAQHVRETRMQEAENHRLVKEATTGTQRPQVIRRLIINVAERALRFTRTPLTPRQTAHDTSEIPALNA